MTTFRTVRQRVPQSGQMASLYISNSMCSLVSRMYQMHRVFCATSWELEAERQAFHDVVAEVNEAEAMPHRLLLVPPAVTASWASATPVPGYRTRSAAS